MDYATEANERVPSHEPMASPAGLCWLITVKPERHSDTFQLALALQ
ncbi:MAG: hypothetical protein AAF152_08445 [Cyanobacteria bacterium P01_A01_bin.114]